MRPAEPPSRAAPDTALRWPDAAAALGLEVLASVVIVSALRFRLIPGVVASYLGHAWMAAIVLVWLFLFKRRFPIGGLQRRMRPWYLLALVLVAASAGETFASPPPAQLHIPNAPTLVAQLIFVAFVVGPTEEFLFRGLIQTSLNASIIVRLSRRGWSIGLGTVVAALLFGLFHMVNLGYQPLDATLQQVATSVIIGLAFGVLYDRTRNLVGASLAHSLADFAGTALPLLAYAVAHR